MRTPLHGRSRTRRLLSRSALAIIVLAWAAAGYGQTPAEDAVALAVKTMRQQIGLDEAKPNPKNPNGLQIAFVKVGEGTDDAGQFVRYRLLVPGAPRDQEYILAIWRIGKPIRYRDDHVFTNARGLVMPHPPSAEQEDQESLEKADEFEVKIRAVRGEPVRYMLASPDGKYFFPGTIVSFPIESSSGPCRLEARLAFPLAIGVLVYADGLPASSQVPLTTSSEGEVHTQTINVDATGHGVAMVAPSVAGKDGGTLSVSVQTAACSLSAQVPWGKGGDALKPSDAPEQ
jgi:hypothetical protein